MDVVSCFLVIRWSFETDVDLLELTWCPVLNAFTLCSPFGPSSILRFSERSFLSLVSFLGCALAEISRLFFFSLNSLRICCLADSFVLPEASESVTLLESIEYLPALEDFEIILDFNCPLLELGAVSVRRDGFGRTESFVLSALRT